MKLIMLNYGKDGSVESVAVPVVLMYANYQTGICTVKLPNGDLLAVKEVDLLR
jgi:hypothetical protein